MKPKLIVNALPLCSKPTGIGRYTYEISKRLAESTEVEFYYGYRSKKLINPYEAEEHTAKFAGVLKKFSLLKKAARKAAMTAAKLSSKEYDLYWEPNFIPQPFLKTKHTVTSVHDFSFMLYKEFHPKERVEYFENHFFKNINKSDALICFSEFTKREIMEYVGFEEARIHVIPHGVDHTLFRPYAPEELAALKAEPVLPQKFVLFVGSIEPRKNLSALLEAYTRLPSDLQSEYKLLLVGFEGWNNETLMKSLEQSKQHIHYMGFVDDVTLAKLYSLATVFVYPSLYEGFGLPILEAMACATPIITSNVTSMPEVGGDAVVHVNPLKTQELSDALRTLLEDEEKRTVLSKKARTRAQKFTWENSARKHTELFNGVLG